MHYLDDKHLRSLTTDWSSLLDVITAASSLIEAGHFAQPLKPYLRYNNPQNRIIAMPAYIGGEINAAGIKWISSFPGNLDLGLPRAHSVLILNEAATGRPRALLNSAMPSTLRTAAVSGSLLREILKQRSMDQQLRIGIIGWGPIGQQHYHMCAQLFEDFISGILLYDLRGIDERAYKDSLLASRTRAASSWQEVLTEANVIITCTAASQRYIDIPPAKGSLLLDVSLRDYKLEALTYIQTIIVDDWQEVCRENTEIEMLHQQRGLKKEDTLTLNEVLHHGALNNMRPNETILFCPMGMAVFDIAVANYLLNQAEQQGIGLLL